MPRDRVPYDASKPRIAAELLLFSEAARALKVLEPVTPVLVIKGASLAELLWQPGERDMTDVDLLVAPNSFAGARRALSAAGWTILASRGRPLANRLHRAFTARSMRGALLDVHASVAQRLRWPVPVTDLLEGAVPLTLGGQPTLRPSFEDSVLIAALNEAKDEHAQHGAGIEDIARLTALDAIDWATVVRRARRWRATVALWLALERARAEFGAAVPDAVRGVLRPRRAAALETLVDLGGRASRLPQSRRLRQAVIGPLVTDSPIRFAVSALAWAAVRAVDAALSPFDAGHE
jgi:hypothetical protein